MNTIRKAGRQEVNEDKLEATTPRKQSNSEDAFWFPGFQNLF
jgi:hypothetical protein